MHITTSLYLSLLVKQHHGTGINAIGVTIIKTDIATRITARPWKKYSSILVAYCIVKSMASNTKGVTIIAAT